MRTLNPRRRRYYALWSWPIATDATPNVPAANNAPPIATAIQRWGHKLNCFIVALLHLVAAREKTKTDTALSSSGLSLSSNAGIVP